MKHWMNSGSSARGGVQAPKEFLTRPVFNEGSLDMMISETIANEVSSTCVQSMVSIRRIRSTDVLSSGLPDDRPKIQSEMMHHILIVLVVLPLCRLCNSLN